MLQTNTIHTGECAEMMAAHLPDNSIDLTVTSPPYDDLRTYNGYTFDFEAIARQLWRVTKPGGVVVWVVADATVNGSETCTSDIQKLYFRSIGFNVHDTMIYKRQAKPLTHNRYEQAFEFMFVFAKPGRSVTCNHIKHPTKKPGKQYDRLTHRHRGKNGKPSVLSGEWRSHKERIKDNVWEYYAGNNQDTDKLNHAHPAPFPEALARDHIISWSNPGDVVLDPMCGSGTTLKMAVEQGRQYIGIDISPEYCEIAAKRVAGARVPLPGLDGTADGKPSAHNQLTFG